MPAADGPRVVALMADVSGTLARGEGVDAMLQGCAESLVRHLGAAFARLWLCAPGSDVLELRASAGLYTRLDGTHSRVRVGELKIGRIAAERRPYLTNAVLDDPSVDRAWARREGMVAFAGYPLVVADRAVGVMALFAREPLAGEVLEALAAIADTVAQYVERERAEAELRQAYALLEQRVGERTHQLTTLLEVGRELAGTTEPRALLEALLEHLKALVEHTMTAILIKEGDELRYAHTRGEPDRWDEAQHVRYPIARFQTVWERLCRDEPVIIPNIRDESPDARLSWSIVAGEPRLAYIRSLMWVPLVVKGSIIGVLTMTRAEPRAFTSREAELARAIARQAAVAIENARLHERDRTAAALEERQRLARELHDSVTQALYSLKLYAEAASRQLEAGQAETAREHLREVRAMAGEALGEMRLLLFELRPPPLEQRGLGAALRARLSAVEARSGLATEVLLDDGIRLPAAVEWDLYRVAQEALNNVLKHARANRVLVALEATGGWVRLEVADDGVGFESTDPGSGLGLIGMRERAEHLGAILRVESTPGAGTRIVVEVPT